MNPIVATSFTGLEVLFLGIILIGGGIYYRNGRMIGLGMLILALPTLIDIASEVILKPTERLLVYLWHIATATEESRIVSLSLLFVVLSLWFVVKVLRARHRRLVRRRRQQGR